jgi:hypothetical protein
MTKNVFHCTILFSMETLHYGKRDDHTHLSQASVVHIDTGRIVERPPSEVVHLPVVVPSQHQL